MELKVIFSVLARRWYFVILAILCTVGATFFVANKVGPTYEAQGAVLIFPPVATVERGAETVTQGNPFLALDGVSQARDIVIRELTSKETADEFDRHYPGTTYVATPDVMNNAPIILITVESPAVDTAVDGVSNIMGLVPTTLTKLQEGLGLDSNSVITSKPLIADQRPESVHKDQIRAAVLAAVVTLGFGLLVIGLIDGLLSGRRRNRHSARASESQAPNEDSHSPATANFATLDRSRRHPDSRPIKPRPQGPLELPLTDCDPGCLPRILPHVQQVAVREVKFPTVEQRETARTARLIPRSAGELC